MWRAPIYRHNDALYKNMCVCVCMYISTTISIFSENDGIDYFAIKQQKMKKQSVLVLDK